MQNVHRADVDSI